MIHSSRLLALPISIALLCVAAARMSLDRGKVYTELDVTANPNTDIAGFIPRIMAGIGHAIEVGINLNGLDTRGPVQTTPTPTLKWRPYNDAERGWAFLVGDDVFSRLKTGPTMRVITFMRK